MSTSGATPFLEEVFRGLPPLGSAEFVAHVQRAPRGELPPEVLARAYRALVAEGREEVARCVLSRLLGARGDRPEYLGHLLHAAARHVPPHQGWQDAQDLFQDSLALILEVLRTPRGWLAERAWNAFCYQRLIDAWRARNGRRGERREPERGELPAPVARPWELAASTFWPVESGPDRAGWLEGFVRRALARIGDPLVRAVAEDQWLSGDPSPISGRRRSASGRASLEQRFGKSRYQIHRALNAARARIFLELERQREVELDLEAFRARLASRLEVAANDAGGAHEERA